MNTPAPESQTGDLMQNLSDFLPSVIIRAETALSRYPIHNLTKTEKINIHIRQRGDIGEAEVYWNVSPSREYGEPRQLAYKVDTLVINRRLDEAGRPTPKLIRLGSLRDICKELDLSPSGENFSGVHLALLQNASAFITARLSYRGADRVTRRFEAAFSRYSVVFTGEELPDGSKADAVYLFLNEHYWKLLNKVQFRPLDYAYQKNLKPAAHRFYELLSYSMYGALTKKRGEAKLVYSDYCLRAPQERYFDRARMQKQMYKIHRPHVESHYLAEVRYEKTVDADGKPDWEIFYTPGPRALAQFAMFNGRQAEALLESRKQPALAESALPGFQRAAELEALIKRGVAAPQARRLLESLPKDQPVLEQLEWGDHMIQQSRRGKFRNPPGFYVHLLRENVIPPSGFRGSRGSTRRAAPRDAGEELYWRRREMELAYEEYRREQAERYIATHLQADEFAAAVRAKRRELDKTYRNLLPEALEEVAAQMVRAEIGRSLPLITFEQFCRDFEQQQRGIGG